jgi:hypothetical protein
MTDSDKRIACILLCSTLALSESEQSTLPLSTSEWNTIASTLHKRELDPSIFLDHPIEQLSELLMLPDSFCNRIQKLLNRAGKLAIEQSAIEGLGIQIATRNDECYPKFISECVGNVRPPLFYIAGEPNNLFPRRIALLGSSEKPAYKDALFQFLVLQTSFEPTTFVVSEKNPMTPRLLECANTTCFNVLVTTDKPLGSLLQQRSYRLPMQQKIAAYVSQQRPDNYLQSHASSYIDWSSYAAHNLFMTIKHNETETSKLIRFLPGSLYALISGGSRIEELPEFVNSPTFTSLTELPALPFEEIDAPVAHSTSMDSNSRNENSDPITHTQIAIDGSAEQNADKNPRKKNVKKVITKTHEKRIIQLTFIDAENTDKHADVKVIDAEKSD